MKKVQKSDFENVIVDESAIFKIIDFFYKIEPSDPERKNYLAIELLDIDGIEYNFTVQDDITSVKNVLTNNKISHISLRFRDFALDNYCSLELTASNSNLYGGNTVKVDGDPEWSTLRFAELREITKFLTPQNNFFAKHSVALFHILAGSFGILALKLIAVVSTYTSSTPQPPTEGSFSALVAKITEAYPVIDYVFFALFAWVIGMWIVFLLFWTPLKLWIDSVWPSIEFDFGPTYLRTPKRVRKVLTTIATLIVIPALLSIFL